MSRATPTVGISIRLPSDLHERLVERRKQTESPTNTFVEEAILEKLSREAVVPKRRNARKAG